VTRSSKNLAIKLADELSRMEAADRREALAQQIADLHDELVARPESELGAIIEGWRRPHGYWEQEFAALGTALGVPRPTLTGDAYADFAIALCHWYCQVAANENDEDREDDEAEAHRVLPGDHLAILSNARKAEIWARYRAEKKQCRSKTETDRLRKEYEARVRRDQQRLLDAFGLDKRDILGRPKNVILRAAEYRLMLLLTDLGYPDRQAAVYASGFLIVHGLRTPNIDFKNHVDSLCVQWSRGDLIPDDALS